MINSQRRDWVGEAIAAAGKSCESFHQERRRKLLETLPEDEDASKP